MLPKALFSALNAPNSTRYSQPLEIAFAKRPAEELYDLTNDPGQLDNVVGFVHIKDVLTAVRRTRSSRAWLVSVRTNTRVSARYSGVISAVNRSIRSGERIFQDFIQIDASINPGNSGGPAFDADGLVRGVVVAALPAAGVLPEDMGVLAEVVGEPHVAGDDIHIRVNEMHGIESPGVQIRVSGVDLEPVEAEAGVAVADRGFIEGEGFGANPGMWPGDCIGCLYHTGSRLRGARGSLAG